ncbi:hypothetical protein ABIB57_004320 [Devosia sp. UYZn731]|uniref:hypothetical protein n=1 Tax=Devosia sp. UYZn731 TaxID=3156345 RepID=UPI003390F009
MTEWMLAMVTAIWGAVLVINPNIFDQPAWSGLRAIFRDEAVVGWIMVGLGFLWIGG